METKLTDLINILKSMHSAVLAYSGGVDSTFLLKALQNSGIRTLAVTTVSEITPISDLHMANEMTAELGIEHRIVETDIMLKEEFLRNTPERCFFCKDELFKKLTVITSAKGYTFLIDGSNVDDTLDYRPGTRAASKYRVRSPLTEAGLSKKEIRELSRQLNLSTWDRPSSPCLATRFPYGQRITKGAIERVGKAEDFLRGLGFHEVRVRVHDEIARIEVDEGEIGSLLTSERRSLISEELKSLGYRFVSLDLDGYRTGSMNRMLEKEHLPR
ncbi:MAG: TIGR00268 family protein [Nitrospirae bacterium RBG_13_43_8]|nr:MAG: TIGR00268 family protein [Nitrospirae bacterium RBG_13_43_8]